MWRLELELDSRSYSYIWWSPEQPGSTPRVQLKVGVHMPPLLP